MNNKVNGVHAFESEEYVLPIKFEMERQAAERSWWAHPFVIVFLTIALSVTDALVLYSVLDAAMMQSEYMGKIMAFTIALVLNFIPLMLAKFIYQAIYKIKKFALLWAIICIAAFVTLFSATISLRLAYRDSYGESNTVPQLTNQVEEIEGEEQYTADMNEEQKLKEEKSLAVVWLLNLSPLVTSLVNFALALLSDDEIKNELNKLYRRRLELYEIKSDLQAAIANMNQDKQAMLDIDCRRYEAAKQEVYAQGELLKALARHILAMHLAEPSSVSILSQEMLEKKN